MVGIGTPSSSAICAVQRPVPFCPALSSTMSTSATPVSGSTTRQTCAVSSMRNDSSAPAFHSLHTSAVSAAVIPRPRRMTSQASAMSCMSPYSMPLCTILTKWPAPSGPTCVTHGPASVRAAIASSTSRSASQAAAAPPGISDGPLRAPSSPPDTPQPTNRMPVSRSAASRRRVSGYHELPPSTSTSPASSSGRSRSIISSTGAPAGIIMRIRRGRLKAATKRSSDGAPVNAWLACSRTNASVHSGSRFHTATGTRATPR